MTEEQGTIFKMYVWREQPDWVVMSHARSVEEARRLALEDSGGPDWSTPIRARMEEHIQSRTPEIHYRQCAEAVLTSSAELEEAEGYIESLKARIKLLEAALRDALEHGKGSMYARNVLDAPLGPVPRAKPSS
jgi:hypothetical protein